ncbi:LCP family protein [Enterococcus faecalis]|uniref:LCP family glycopolymer transferase n=1 Tax=Enterococcus faecalis TaxID=1351 RepID=UPI002DB6CBF4|nr:LCP family protein [Enterococcus faecalis]MEB7428025.1 LCP family protein [Enterococcus faecalis]
MRKLIISGIKLFLLLLIVLGILTIKMYHDVEDATNSMYNENLELKGNSNKLNSNKPFSILLLGIDTGNYGRVDKGRSDTLMVGVVNPKTQKTTIISIPRDTYTEIVGHYTWDKVNHAYSFGGASMTANTINKLLDIQLDYYISINMKGLEDFVDVLGGITINNQIGFVQNNYTFEKGTVKLNGKRALSYSRMRYADPEGDYGRQKRQRLVVEALLNKLLSISTVFSYTDLLSIGKNNIETNITFNEMKKILTDYNTCLNNIETEQLKGTGITKDGISYQEIQEEELIRIKEVLKKELE